MASNPFFRRLVNMPQPPSTQHLTEIQTLSLLPDKNIGSWSSEARKALQDGLRTTASHPKCISIYWLRKTEDPQTIAVISKWSEPVHFTASKSYLHALLPHLKSPPARSIHVNHVPHSFSSYTISNFLTVYFPMRNCSANFKSLIAANVTSFANVTEPTYSNPESLRFLASGWIKETKMLAGEVVNGFMFCLMWTDRESEELYKRENERWRVLMRFLKTMGMIREEQFHGKVFQVLGEEQKERFEFSDHSSDDDDMDEQLVSMRERLNMLAPLCSSGLEAPEFSGNPIEAPLLERPGPDISRLREAPILSSFPVLRHDASKDQTNTIPWWEDDTEKAVADDSDFESPDSTPLLTPSSSTMSLNSLFDESKSMSGLPGTWKSEYDISRAHDDVAEITSFSNSYGDSVDFDSTQPISPECSYQSKYSGDVEDEDDDVRIAEPEELESRLRALATETPTPAAQKLELNLNHDPPRRSTNQRDEKAMSDLEQRGAMKWDPEEELRNAKLRFWGRRKRLPPQMEIRRATSRGRSPLTGRALSTARGLTIDPLRSASYEDKRKGSWWAYLRECLPNRTAGSTANADVEADYDVEMGSREGEQFDESAALTGVSNVGMCLRRSHDAPLSVQQMVQAKTRLSAIR